MTIEETAKIISMLKLLWPEQQTGDPESFLAVWHMVVEDVPFEEMRRAVKTYARDDHAFMPKPGQLIALIAAQAYDDLVPDVVWPEIKREIRRHPFGVKKIYDPVLNKSIENPGPSFSHQLIQAAVDGIGWDAICRAEDEQEMQKTFFFTLRELKNRAVAQVRHEPMTEPLPAVEGNGVYALNGASR